MIYIDLPSKFNFFYQVLEEVSSYHSWDRPDLFSPIKNARKSELKFGNSVFVVTKLPCDVLQLNKFLDVEPDRFESSHKLK